MLASTSGGPSGGGPHACPVSRPTVPSAWLRQQAPSKPCRLLRAGGLSAWRSTSTTAGALAVTATASSGGGAQLLTALAHEAPLQLPAPVETAFLPASRCARTSANSDTPSTPNTSSAATGSPPRVSLPTASPRQPASPNTGNANSLDTVDHPVDESMLFSLGWAEFDRTRYKAQGVLGSGGYGTVYLALDEVTGDLVAVKRIPKTRKSSAPNKVKRNLLKEAELLEAMQFCPSVVRLYGKYEDDRNAYLVMQHLEGGSLEDYVQRNRRQLTEDDVAAVCMVVLQFLAEAHAAGVVFADVKPSNFMLTGGHGGRGLSLQVIDFGCSQAAPKEGDHLTQRCGTYKYFAPEVFHQRYGSKADVWSCGIMVYRILSNDYPWWKAGVPVAPAEAMNEICGSEPIPFPSTSWDSWSPEARQFVESLLERDPAARPSAAEAMANPWLTAHMASYQRSQQAAAAAPLPSVNNVVPLSACRNKSWIKRDQHEAASMNAAAL